MPTKWENLRRVLREHLRHLENCGISKLNFTTTFSAISRQEMVDFGTMLPPKLSIEVFKAIRRHPKAATHTPPILTAFNTQGSTTSFASESGNTNTTRISNPESSSAPTAGISRPSL